MTCFVTCSCVILSHCDCNDLLSPPALQENPFKEIWVWKDRPCCSPGIAPFFPPSVSHGLNPGGTFLSLVSFKGSNCTFVRAGQPKCFWDRARLVIGGHEAARGVTWLDPSPQVGATFLAPWHPTRDCTKSGCFTSTRWAAAACGDQSTHGYWTQGRGLFVFFLFTLNVCSANSCRQPCLK